MKKFFSLALSLTLLFALTAPAAAWETAPAIPPEYDWAEDLVWDEEWEEPDWEQDRLLWIEEFEQENPQWRENYRKHAPYAQWGCDSVEALMAEMDFATEAEAWDWLCDRYIDSESYQSYPSLIDRVAAGGPAFGAAVLWMGEFVVFPDAKPELVDGRTMVPVRAFMELAGAQVAYLDGAVILTMPDETTIRFTPGETQATVVSAAGENTFEMDVAPYIQDGRSYVPVRFFSQALGYDVFWDSDYKTAVILQRQAVIDELNRSFSRANRMCAARSELDASGAGSFRTSGTLRAELTLFDSLDGDKTAQAAGTISGYSSPQGMNLTVDMDGRALVSLLIAQLGLDMTEYPEELNTALAALGRLQLSLIQDTEKGILYIQLPGLLGELLGLELPENCWLSMPVPESGPMPENLGEWIYESAPQDIWGLDYMRESAAGLAGLIGDERFTRSGGADVLHIGEQEIQSICEDFGIAPELFDLTLRRSDGGALSGSAVMRTAGLDLFGLPTSQYTVEFSASASGSSLFLESHTKNQSVLSLTLRTQRTAYNQSFPLSPDAGATVLTEYELGIW